MKRNVLLLLCLMIYSRHTMAQLSEKQIASQKPLALAGNFLLKTSWDQWGIYAKYSPENQVLGCWSTALAQILYYHRLKPHGIVGYTCSKGYQIKDTLSNYYMDWRDFQPLISQSSAAKNIEAVSRYSYLTAVAIGKDFGTPRYQEMINPGPVAERHFDCVTEFYACFTGDVPFSKEQMMAISRKERINHIVNQNSIQDLIKKEIDQKRPVYFHMGNFGSYGHSTVIDGYLMRDESFFVHINYGAGGFRTGWYNLFKAIDVDDDIRLRAFVTVRPNGK